MNVSDDPTTVEFRFRLVFLPESRAEAGKPVWEFRSNLTCGLEHDLERLGVEDVDDVDDDSLEFDFRRLGVV